jgi:hypothetical protein
MSVIVAYITLAGGRWVVLASSTRVDRAPTAVSTNAKSGAPISRSASGATSCQRNSANAAAPLARKAAAKSRPTRA